MTSNQCGTDQKIWGTRPIFSVSDIQLSLDFYCGLLGFEQSWTHVEQGQTVVTQVNRDDCEIILSRELDRLGGSRIYLSLDSLTVSRLENLMAAGKISAESIHWGYPLIKMIDPDGNELLFRTNPAD